MQTPLDPTINQHAHLVRVEPDARLLFGRDVETPIDTNGLGPDLFAQPREMLLPAFQETDKQT